MIPANLIFFKHEGKYFLQIFTDQAQNNVVISITEDDYLEISTEEDGSELLEESPYEED